MKTKKIICCEKCGGQINDKYDLVVTNYFWQLVCYHNECYSEALKGPETIFLRNKPINGSAGNVIFIISLILGPILLLFPKIRYLSAVFFFYIVVRIYSWLKFERHMEN